MTAKDLQKHWKLHAGLMLLFFAWARLMTWSGENASRSSIALPQMQEELAKELEESRQACRTGIGKRLSVGIEPSGTGF